MGRQSHAQVPRTGNSAFYLPQAPAMQLDEQDSHAEEDMAQTPRGSQTDRGDIYTTAQGAQLYCNLMRKG